MKTIEYQAIMSFITMVIAVAMFFSVKMSIEHIIDQQMQGYINTCEQGVQIKVEKL